MIFCRNTPACILINQYSTRLFVSHYSVWRKTQLHKKMFGEFCLTRNYSPNTLAYFASSSATKTKRFIGLTPGCGLDVKYFRLLLDDHLDEVLEQVLHNNVFLCLRCCGQGILKGEISLHCWPPVWLVWNQLYDNWQFLFLFSKQTNPNQ